ncbi:MAG: hypothetical protein IKS63_03825 [Firmicutes bacterium]|nr:hypothetical protein [Bacillota bacterium]
MKTRRKYIAVITAIAMLLALIPSVSFAGETAGDTAVGQTWSHTYKTDGKSFPVADRHDGKNTPKVMQDELEALKQDAINDFTGCYEYYIHPKDQYCNAIWQEIQDLCTSVIDEIDSCKTFADIYTAHDVGCEALLTIGKLTKKRVKTGSAEELASFKTEKINALNNIYKEKSKAEYTPYYNDIIEDQHYIGKVNIKKAATFAEVMMAYTSAYRLISNSPTAKEFAQYVKTAKAECKEEVMKPLVKSDYTKGDWEIITDTFNKQMKVLEKLESVEEIDDLYYELFNIIFEALPVNEKYSSSLASQYYSMLIDALNSYDSADYTDSGYEKLWAVEEAAEEAFDHAMTNYAEKKIVDRAIEDMKKVPTYKEELKALKKKLCKKLDKYVGSKKYVQKKVRPIVKAGKKAIKKCDTIKDANQTFRKYNKKALATVKKFRIKSHAGKGGTITKSKTVKYGSKAVFKIKAKKKYKISELRVDGKKVKIVKKYTFKNVKKNHTIKVKFRKK